MTSLVNGLPLLAVSHIPDEVFQGHQVRDSGAGPNLSGAAITDSDIDAALQRLLSPNFTLPQVNCVPTCWRGRHRSRWSNNWNDWSAIGCLSGSRTGRENGREKES
ncbi:hypothetical protein [Micromonospora sp. DT53]|uniref:hypothetical protein n=1 Tax=Micromonospora sp. DT53 TaxID=3393444 RepID=UPI003CE740F4